MTDLSECFTRSLVHFAPPPTYSPSEWAEKNVHIPIGNAVPGLIKFDHAPYQREPLDLTNDPSIQRITLQWGAQVGKTMLALCAQAYKIAQDPQSQLMMQPSQGDLTTWLETKFNPLVEANEQLAEIIATPRARDGVNNQRMKSYPGGFIMFSWSGSPKTMRGRSAPFIVCDEIDAYDKTTEGHPVSLLWQRAATFGDQRKLLEISTPTLKNTSFIERSFEDGDQRYFFVDCPHCQSSQRLVWSNVQWEEDKPETAKYLCHDCGALWDDGERISAIRRGRWEATSSSRGHASFHLNELYSCFRKLGDIAESFLERKRTGDLQTFVNVTLAETWEEQGDGIDGHILSDRVEQFPSKWPESVLVAVAGVDVQDDRLELEILGIGRDEETWSLSYIILRGDPTSPQVWADLDEILFAEYETEDGRKMSIRGTAIDTGYHTQTVYKYVKSRSGQRVFAVKGVAGEAKALVGRPSRNNSGKINLFPVGVDTAKELVYARLRIEDAGPGFCHFPDDRPEEYFHQLTAEQLVVRYVRGHARRVWKQTRPRNEALDCRVYAIACYHILNINVNIIRLEKSPEKAVKTKPRGLRKTGFVNNW